MKTRAEFADALQMIAMRMECLPDRGEIPHNLLAALATIAREARGALKACPGDPEMERLGRGGDGARGAGRSRPAG